MMFDKSKKIPGKPGLLVILLIVTLLVNGYSFAANSRDNGETGRTGTITGQLLDKYTQQPLPGAEVSILNTTLKTLSNTEGEFEFKNVPVGSYSLKFNYPGMVPQVKTDIIIKSKRTTVVTAEIELISMANESVSVTAGYFDQASEEPSGNINFNYEEIRRAPGSGGDVNRIIASLPSIAKVSDQANNLAVRGGSAAENLFILDNIEIPNINHFPFLGSSGGAISILNVDFLEDVDFYAGGFSAIYGDRLSSVIDMTFREGNRDHFNGQLSLDMGGAGLVAEGPIFKEKGSWMFSARRSYLDLLVDILNAGAAVGYSDFQGKIVYNPSPRSKLTILGLMGIDKSNVSQQDAIDQGESEFGDTRSREHTLGLNWFYMWSDKSYANTSLSHSYTKFDHDYWRTSTGDKRLENRSGEETWHLRHVNHFNVSHSQRLRFGLEVKKIDSQYDYSRAAYIDVMGNPTAPVLKDIRTDAVKAAVFVEDSLDLFSRVTFNLGVRADYFDYNKHLGVSPRASLAFKITGKTSVSLAAGIFRQTLPLLLLYQHEINRDSHDLLTYQYTFGINHLLTENTRLTLEAYYKDYRHFPIDPVQPSVCLLDSVIGTPYFGETALLDSGKARAYGIEFVLQKKLKQKVYGMVSGSYFRTQYRDLEGKWRNRIFDNQYIFSLQGGYKPNKKWEFSLRWIIAGGMPSTPYDREASRAANSGIFSVNLINSQRLPAYHSLSLRFDKRFYFSGSNLILYVSIWNAYNRKNVASYYWNEIKNEPDYSYQFSILPIIGLEYEF